MPDPIHLQLDRFRDVVADELKSGMSNPARDVGLASGEIVVETDHFIAILHQAVDQVGAEKAGTASDEVDLHTQGLSSLSKIPNTGDNATLITS